MIQNKYIVFFKCDTILLLLLCLLSGCIAVGITQRKDVRPQFYQREFAPAVMYACGKGFVMHRTVSRDLSDFLLLKRDSFDCEKIPAGGDQMAPTTFQAAHIYLLKSVGFVWKITGISWNHLQVLYALFYAITAAAAYGIFRLGMGRLVAFSAVVFLVFSSCFLNNLIHLRDLSKVPFIFVIVFFMGGMVRYSLNGWRVIALSVLAGVTIGIGIGFRMDLLIMLPAVVATLFFFLPGGIFENLKLKAFAIIIFGVAFALSGWPVLKVLGGGGNMFHVIILGLMAPFDNCLGVEPSLYEWGYRYNDIYVNSILNSYNHRVIQADQFLKLGTAEYDRIGLRYFFIILANFPADLIARYYAAILKILTMNLGTLSVFMPFIAVVCLGGIAAKNLRYALYATLLILFLAGYPSLQFHERHYFHLQIITYWFLAILVSSVLTILMGSQDLSIARFCHFFSMKKFYSTLIKGFFFVLFITGTLYGVLYSLRLWQQSNLTGFFQQYDTENIQPITLKEKLVDDDAILFNFPNEKPKNPTSKFPIETRYFVAEFGGELCQFNDIMFNIIYDSSDEFNDGSRSVSLTITPGTKYFFATYSYGERDANNFSLFQGIRLDNEAALCLSGISEIKETNRFPLLLNLLLRPDWQQEILYQQIGRVKKIHHYSGTKYYKNSSIEGTKIAEFAGSLSGVPLQSAVFRADIVANEGSGMIVKGQIDTAYSYLLQLPPQEISKIGYLIAEGELYNGGLTLGVLKNESWGENVNITEPCKFRVAIKVEKGVYVPILANNVQNQKNNHFSLTKLGWVDPEVKK